ncbi:hypothetical protein IQ268_15290 [Oculatella sp. LEGE 06141]|uniref:hypothetical protein n=1 Tax=Oculatella sp. LEGE 06141 TaxID=1828648 RepID=UPI00188133FA|nr:hypothetical protein [Oculatella sp. LEGE 06141]MBE9179935.1 hypothetical protein [Oculatella sp. LEGE 06141]
MNQLLWVAIAYIGGIAAILGSLMLLGSLLLWLVPRTKSTPSSPLLWQNRLKLTGFSLLLSLLGVGLLVAIPFPGGLWQQ